MPPRRCLSYTPPFKFDEKLKNLNKNNFELVIARYDEDISWSNNYKDFRTIYNKGNDDIPESGSSCSNLQKNIRFHLHRCRPVRTPRDVSG